ncbi:MAG: deoxyuridine 5'-triphosphate nucleotidohydrolase [Candidatus Bathyarchaeia archaeon]
MILTGSEIRDLISKKGLIENYIDLGVQIQPNGIDLTVGKIELVRPVPAGVIDFSGENRTFPDRRKVGWAQGAIELSPRVYYLGWTNEKVNMPLNMTGVLRPRTSAFTMGLALFTGVVDAGFRGRIRFGLLVYNPVRIKKNARLLHMLVIRLSKTTFGYAGIWKE